MKYGLIEEKIIDPRDYSFGGVTGISDEILQEDGQWDDFLPPPELQRNYHFETMACGSFAIANAIEIILKRKFDLDKDYSDRLLAKLSNTTRRGNYGSKIAETVRKKGLVLEKYWEFDRELIKTWDEFYRIVPNPVIELSLEWPEEFDFKWEWVFSNNLEIIKDALRRSPLVIPLYAWGVPDTKGVYQRTNKKRNHFVVLYGYKDGEYWKVFDTYNRVYKKVAWNYNIGSKMKFDINLKNFMPNKFDNNTLINLVEGGGNFGLYLDGKIIVDSLDKILASWLARNNGKIEDKVKSVTQEVWDEFPKINLKKEAI